MNPPPQSVAADFHGAFQAATRTAAADYGVAVVVGDVTPPFKGDLDGAEIVIGADNDAEARLFLVAHLFGHTVQWNTSETSRRLGMTMPVSPSTRQLNQLADYELEACRYSQQLLHEAGVEDLDQWLADYAACDHAFLKHFYLTGERLAFARFWRGGTPLLEPLAIPAFSPRRWRRRGRAIVV